MGLERTGGAFQLAQGGDFQSGFLGGFAGSAAGSLMGSSETISNFMGRAGDKDFVNIVGRTTVAAVVGGTVSTIGGGKFGNGAYSAAFQHLLNAETTKREIGDIRVTKAEVRISRPGFGPEADELFESYFEFSEVWQKAPLPMPTDAGDFALWAAGALGVPTTTAGGYDSILHEFKDLMNSWPPLQVHVSFEYEVFMGKRTGISAFFFGRQKWSPTQVSASDLRVAGPLMGGTFGSSSSAFEAGIGQLISLRNEARNNSLARHRKVTELLRD